MKKILFLLASCLYLAEGHCQTSQGSFMVGSSVSELSFDKSVSNFYFSPQAGYFVADNLALGLFIPVGFAKVHDTGSKASSLGISPFVRYYIGQKKLRPFVAASYGYRQNNVKNIVSGMEAKIRQEFSSISASLGLAYFVSEYVSVDVTLNGSRQLDPVFNTLKINAGFQVFLPGKK